MDGETWGAGNEELWNRFREGEAGTLAAVYRLHVAEVSRTARAILNGCGPPSSPYRHPASDLADVVQEVFTKAFAPAARRRFDDQRRLRPYLLQIARHVAIDHWRVRRRHLLLDNHGIVEHLSHEVVTAGEDLPWTGPKLVAVVERFIGSVDPDDRRGYEALYVRGLSQRAAAAELGVGRQVMRTIEARLRSGLERELTRGGYAERDPSGTISVAESATR